MPDNSTQSPSRALTAWLRRNDWALYEKATTAVETEEALQKGVSAVNKGQLRAVVNTARMCSTPSRFRGFLKKRAERRSAAGQDRKARFWGALKSHLNDIEEEAASAAQHAAAADHEKEDLEEAKMRVVRTYFEHLVSHCQVAGR